MHGFPETDLFATLGSLTLGSHAWFSFITLGFENFAASIETSRRNMMP
jgi:hypothetical protein